MHVNGFEEGGSGYQNGRSLLTGIGPGIPVILHVNVCGESVDWTSPEEVPPQGGKKAGGDETLDMDGRELVLTSAR